jgi:hypothetical protein
LHLCVEHLLEGQQLVDVAVGRVRSVVLLGHRLHALDGFADELVVLVVGTRELVQRLKHTRHTTF